MQRRKEPRFCKSCGIKIKELHPILDFGRAPDFEEFNDGVYCYSCAEARKKQGTQNAKNVIKNNQVKND